MPLPPRLARAWEEGGERVFRTALKKSAKTRAAQQRTRARLKAIRAAEAEAAEVWYRERVEQERARAHALSPGAARRDELLSPEDL